MLASKHVVILKSGARQAGGLEKHAARIANAFYESGSQVSILTTELSKQNFSTPPHFSYIEAPLSKWPSFLRMEQFDSFVRSWLSQHPADIVFGMERNRMQTHLRAGNGVHQAYLKSRIHIEGIWKYRLCQINPHHRKILEFEKSAFTYPGLKKIIANSLMVKNEIIDFYDVDDRKIEVIHNGVEWREMEADFSNWKSLRPEIGKHLGLDTHLFQFLFIGNGYSRKGLDVLLQAIASMPDKNFQLSVIGKDRKLESYKAKAAKMGLQNRVHFFGPRSHIMPFYQLADSLVIPSFYDPFANVTVEALAMGLFVVSSRSNGGHEIITSQNGAVIEDLLDPDSIIESLTRAINHKKTQESSLLIRKTAASLDFTLQSQKLIKACE